MRYICLAMPLLLLLALLRHKPQPTYIDTPVHIDTVFTFPEQSIIENIDYMAHINYMRKHIGVPTKDTINLWLSSVGLPPGNPFCSAALSHSLDVAGVTSPSVRSGLAMNFVFQTDKSIQIDPNDVYKQIKTVPAGSIVVYRRGDTRFGHNGFLIDSMTGNRGVYISANTSAPGSSGSESAGGGVYEKDFSINPYSYFRVNKFVLVSYEN